MATRLEQELAYNHKHYPGFLKAFLGSMERGEVHGLDMTQCFYGQLAHGDTDEALTRVQEAMNILGGASSIEYALLYVRPGDTPTSDTKGGQELRDFKSAIEFVLTSSTVPI